MELIKVFYDFPSIRTTLPTPWPVMKVMIQVATNAPMSSAENWNKSINVATIESTLIELYSVASNKTKSLHWSIGTPEFTKKPFTSTFTQVLAYKG